MESQPIPQTQHDRGRTLSTATDVIVGLNPGGPADGDYGEHWEYPDNAYFKPWDSGAQFDRIQLEVQRWHTLLGIDKDRVFIGQFIPFRSVRESELKQRPDTLEAARNLWRWAIEQAPHAKRFICIGETAAVEIGNLLKVSDWEDKCSGWGNVTVGRAVTSTGHVVARLPHPSTFNLLGQSASDKVEKARAAIRWAAKI